jgi:Arc/MetJ-type ribon-helix-helix transcriptional regulator
MVQTLHGGPFGPVPDGPSLTPVMARLGRKDLATLDTLITAGIASSRADAVRWALARIRERPAFEQLRTHAREIENLKSQF